MFIATKFFFFQHFLWKGKKRKERKNSKSDRQYQRSAMSYSVTFLFFLPESALKK